MQKSRVHLPSLAELKPNAPGILVGIYQGKKTLLEEEIGYSDIMTSKPISREMHFRVGSLTKTAVTTVILRLVDQVLLSLEDPVSPLLGKQPWLKKPLPETLTVKHLGNSFIDFSPKELARPLF